MTVRTWTSGSSGAWDNASNWSGGVAPGVPGIGGFNNDDAAITNAGSYTIALTSYISPDNITLGDANAVLSEGATGLIAGSNLTLSAGTFALAGEVLGSTVQVTGGLFAPSGGTLNSVTWDGPLAGAGNVAGYSVAITNGISLNDAAGTAPGTLEIGSLYVVNVTDATTLDNLTIDFGAVNNEYLNGSNNYALNLGSAVVVQETASGVAGLINGTIVNAAGTVNAASNGGYLYIGATTFDNSGTLLVSNRNSTEIHNAFVNTGAVTVSSSSTLALRSSSASLNNTSTIDVASAGTLIAATDLGGSGTVALASFAVADVHNVAGTVLFQDGRGGLLLRTPGSFTGGIGGFQKGDSIDLPGATISGTSFTGSTAGGMLAVTYTTAGTVTPQTADLTLFGDYTAATFSFGSDGQTGSKVTVACYIAGTRILTETGEVPVEQLAVGDRVVTIVGQDTVLKPVRWMGHAQVNLARHPEAESVAPVRILAGALAEGVPCRDLLVSPDHALLIDDALLPARLLVNGATVRREPPRGTVQYWHVELDEHAVLLADGAAAESYLDTGNRADFANAGAVAVLHPTFAAADAPKAQRCRPLVTYGARAAAAHAAVLARALSLGHRLTEDAGLRIEVDGVRAPTIQVAPGHWRTRLTAGAQRVVLCTRPVASDDPTLADGRNAGVPVACLRLDGASLPLTSPVLARGFHPLETAHGAAWRWTEATAELLLPARAEPADFDIVTYAGWRRYWVEPAPDAAAIAA